MKVCATPGEAQSTVHSQQFTVQDVARVTCDSWFVSRDGKTKMSARRHSLSKYNNSNHLAFLWAFWMQRARRGMTPTPGGKHKCPSQEVLPQRTQRAQRKKGERRSVEVSAFPKWNDWSYHGYPLPPCFCVCTGMIGLTGAFRRSTGMIGVRRGWRSKKRRKSKKKRRKWSGSWTGRVLL